MRLSPAPFFQGLDDNGNPLTSGTLETYAAGTSTPLATYQDAAGTPNATVIDLDAGGRCDIWLPPGLAYDFVLKNSAGTTIKTIPSVQGGSDRESVVFPTLADLTAIPFALLVEGIEYRTLGYTTVGDGGNKRMRWDDDSQLTVDGGYVVGPDDISSNDGRLIDIDIEAGSFIVEKWGAIGDGATTHTTEIQAAIDYVSSIGGGYLIFKGGGGAHWRGVGIVLKSGVILKGPRIGPGRVDDYSFQIQASATGIVIDTPATTVYGCGIDGLAIRGLGSGTAGKGIRFQDVVRGVIKNFLIDSFDDEGILMDSASAGDFGPGLLQSCLLDRSRVAKIGVMDITGSDCRFRFIESTASLSIEGAASDANLYICAWLLRAGGNHFIEECIGEISDVGLHIINGVSICRITGFRSDLNYGNGLEENGQRNLFANCLFYRNSRDTHNTYDGVVVSSSSAGSKFVNCDSGSTGADIGVLAQRYGWNDASQNATPSSRTRYVNVGHEFYNTTALFNFTGTASVGPTPDLPHVNVLASDTDTSPSVTNSTLLNLQGYATPTTITDFDDALGAQFLFLVGDPQVTIQTGSGIITSNGLDKVLKSNAVYLFQHYNGTWYEVTGERRSGAIPALADDATPSVLSGELIGGRMRFLTGGTTTITDFDDGWEGLEITIISEHAITITDGTNILLNGSANFVMAATDTLTLVQKADGKWYELGRSDNT